MARKTATFGQLATYMERKADARYAYFWNLEVPYGSSREEVVRQFEGNDRHLRSRQNGNRLYHEILSLQRTKGLSEERQKEILHDLAAKWLADRAPGQMGYARMHVEKGHVHYHIMLSANEVGKDRPVRLARDEFSQKQRNLEEYAIQRFPQLELERRYNRDPKERTRQPRHREDAMRRRTGCASDRERAAGVLKEAFSRARNPRELADALNACGFTVHQRGDTVSFAQKGRRYRLKTLGLEKEYRQLSERLAVAQEKENEMSRVQKTMEKVKEAAVREPANFARETGNLADAMLFGAERYRSLDRDRGRVDASILAQQMEIERLKAEFERLRAEIAARPSENKEKEQISQTEEKENKRGKFDDIRAQKEAAKKRSRDRDQERDR